MAALLIGGGAPAAFAACTQVGSGGYDNTTSVSGLCITNTSFAANIQNSGTISPSGVKFSNGTMSGGIISTGVINGGLSLDLNSKLTFGTTPINISGASFSGGITNAGTISAAASGGVFGTGIWLHDLSSFAGGITNSGTIKAGTSGAGIFLGNGAVTRVTGDIVNNGVIIADVGVNVEGSRIFSGNLSNAGTINASASGTGLHAYGVSTFTGSILNSGTITAGFNGMVFQQGFTLGGGVTNTGFITTRNGDGIFVGDVGFVNGSIINGVGATIAAGTAPRTPLVATGINVQTGFTLAGSIFNGGLITAPADGISVSGFLVAQGISNAGTISVGGYAGIEADGGVTNTGIITDTGVNTLAGPHYGISATTVSNAAGATISASTGGSGAGIGIDAAAATNAGTITASTGIAVFAGVSTGYTITNSGTITGSTAAIDVTAASSAVTIDQTGGLISGAIKLSDNADVLNITGGVISGNIVGSGSSDTVDFALGTGTFTYSSTISGVHSTTLASGTLFDGGVITAGSVNVNGGSLAPGLPHTIGTLTITGSLVFASAAVYLDTISGANASKTAITGAATLGGATVQIAGGSTVTGGTKYTILTDTLGGLGVSGNTFAGNVSYSGDTGTISYDPSGDDVYLTFAQSSSSSNLLSQLPPGTPANEINVANAIDTYINGGGTLPANFQTLFNFTPSQLETALSEFDGEDATGAATGTFQLVNDFFNLLSDIALGTGGGGTGANGTASGFAAEANDALPPDVALAYRRALKQSAAAPPQDFEQRWTAWASGYGGGATYDGNATVGSNTLAASDYGYAGGMDYRASPDLKLGFALAGGGTNWSIAQNLGSGRSDVFQAAGYGIKHYGPLYFTAMAAFGNSWFATNRTAALGDELRANFDGQDYALRGEAGYRFAVLPMAGLTPYAAIQSQWLHTPGYNETDLTGGGFGLTYAAQNANDTRSELGVRADDLVTLDNMPLILRARLAWAHDGVSGAALTPTFQALPGASFIVNGAAVPQNSALVSAGGQLFLTANWSFEAKFDGEFASSAETYAGTGMLRYSW